MVGAAIYLSVVLVATSLVGIHYLLSSLLGTGVSAVWNYTTYHHIVFRPRVSREGARPARAA
jgi:putative flippase GtrA